MSIPDLTQVLLINALCVIFIYFFKGVFPSFYGDSFEEYGMEITDRTFKSINITY